MNECFAAEPSCVSTAGDLRYLLGLFGPQAGRYLVPYPSDWERRVLEHFETLPDLELAKIKARLQTAKQGLTFLDKPSLPWAPELPWIQNAVLVKTKQPPRIDEVIGAEPVSGVLQFDELGLSPTADEKIRATPAEYERVSLALLNHSWEVFLIDPYLSPCKKDMRVVLEQLFAGIGRSDRCRDIICFARGDYVVGDRKHSWEEVVAAWHEIIRRASWKTPRRLRYVLVDDDHSKKKMHDRYLFSVKGGIRFGQGFQSLTNSRRVDVSPVGKSVLDDLLKTYLENEHDMNILRDCVIST
jgi:hypothetical protein